VVDVEQQQMALRFQPDEITVSSAVEARFSAR